MSRTKMVTVLAAMALTFAILPTFGAAADTLDPGDYVVSAGGGTYGFTVTDDGQALVDATVPSNVELRFQTSDDGISETVTVVVGETEFTADAIPVGDGDGSTTLVVGPVGSESTNEVTSPELEEPEPSEGGTDEDEADNRADGDVVSTVARCAPRGRDAKEAELPTHGTFVSAAAAGASIEFDFGVDPNTGNTLTKAYDFSDMTGAQELCNDREVLLAGPHVPDEPTDGEPSGRDTTESSGDETGGNGNGQERQAERDNGRPDNAGPKNKD